MRNHWSAVNLYATLSSAGADGCSWQVKVQPIVNFLLPTCAAERATKLCHVALTQNGVERHVVETIGRVFGIRLTTVG